MYGCDELFFFAPLTSLGRPQTRAQVSPRAKCTNREKEEIVHRSHIFIRTQTDTKKDACSLLLLLLFALEESQRWFVCFNVLYFLSLFGFLNLKMTDESHY